MGDDIRIKILSQTKPFCLIDIQRRLKQYDPGLVLRNLDELYECGLIQYGEFKNSAGEKVYCFYIEEPLKELTTEEPKKLENKMQS